MTANRQLNRRGVYRQLRGEPSGHGVHCERAQCTVGQSTIELVGITVAIAALLSAAIPVFKHWGSGSTARAVSGVLNDAVAGKSTLHSKRWQSVTTSQRTFGSGRANALPRPIPGRSWTQPATAWRAWSSEQTATNKHLSATTKAHACLMCIGASYNVKHSLNRQAKGGKGDLLSATSSGEIFATPVFVGVDNSLGFKSRHVGAKLKTHADALIGTQVNGALIVGVGGNRQKVQLGGTAVLGAKARAEAEFGATMVGITATQNAAVEGWAGLGATGKLTLEHAKGRFKFGGRIGGSVGLGGAMDFETTVDFSRASPYVRAATQFLKELP